METKKIKLLYTFTGVKTLKVMAVITLIVCILGALICVAYGFENAMGFAYAAISLLFGLINYGLLLAVATITETAVMIKAKAKFELKESEVEIAE